MKPQRFRCGRLIAIIGRECPSIFVDFGVYEPSMLLGYRLARTPAVRPPRDHRWLHIDGDYVLVAIATGVITSIVTGY